MEGCGDMDGCYVCGQRWGGCECDRDAEFRCYCCCETHVEANTVRFEGRVWCRCCHSDELAARREDATARVVLA